jgi:hypothetical protein
LAPLRVRRREGRGEKKRHCSIGLIGRLVALLVGALGVCAFWRRRRRTHAEPEYSPADELKAKLAESRTEEDEAEQPVLETDLDARRREVHDQARGAIDDLS